MAGLERRLERLEERSGLEQRAASEEREKRHWLLRARLRQNELLGGDAKHARSLIALFRVQGILPGISTDELVSRILAWRPVPDGGRSRATVQREVGLAIHNREQGMENMVCPSSWRESFVRGDDLREKYAAIPDEVLAEGYLRLGEIGEDEAGLAEWSARYEEAFGITEELVRSALGPDADEITEEERHRRIFGYLVDAVFGEKGYRAQRRLPTLRDGEA